MRIGLSCAGFVCWASGTASGQFLALPMDGFGQAQGNALSDDGRVVAGVGVPLGGGTSLSFRWTRDGGRQDFGLNPGFPEWSHALGISGDGGTVVGWANATRGLPTAYRWSASGGYQNLGSLSGVLTWTFATDASRDGGVVVGYGTDRNEGLSEPFVWTQARGMRSLGRYPGAFFTNAVAVSEDGGTVVGWSSGVSNRGWTWTEAGGYRPLRALPGTNGSTTAYGANGDASIIVGDAGGEAAMWRGSEVMALGTLPDGYDFHTTSVDDAGSIVVGHSDLTNGWLATVWTMEHGVQTLADYLVVEGIAIPSGVLFASCSSVSADGRTVTGTAYLDGVPSSAFAYVVTVPSPASGLVLAGLAVPRRRRR